MIKNNLAVLMCEKGFTNRKLAKLTGVHEDTIQRIKKGRKKQIDIELMNNIYKVMELKPTDIIFQYVPD